MNTVKYRIEFRIEETIDKSKTRDSRIDAVFSSIQNIDTETKIEAPSVGSIIEIDGIDYEIVSRKYSFLNEGQFVIFSTIIGIINTKTKKEIDDISKNEWARMKFI